MYGAEREVTMETRGRYKRRDRQRGFDLKRMKLGREKSNSDRNLLPGGGEIIIYI